MPTSTATAPSCIVDPVAAVLSTGELETELLGLAGNLAAAQCRFLQLLAEYNRRGGWAGPGLRSCAHWLSWRIGMSLRTATEHVRVAHALAELPKITEAFAAGRLSYSKVRAITRISGLTAADPDRPDPAPDEAGPDVAGPGPSDVHEGDGPSSRDLPPQAGSPQIPALVEDAEQVLLDLALAGTASHVETVVRTTRRSQADPARNAALRSLSWHHADDGSLVLRGRFSADEGALLVAAIEASVTPSRPAAHPVPAPPDGWCDTGREQAPGAVVDRVAARRADALLMLVGGGAGNGGAGDGVTVARGQAHIVVHVETSTGGARIEGGPEIPAATAQRLACDAHAQVLLHDRSANRLYLGRSHRLATPAQIAALAARDGTGCRFPGCSHTRHLQAHHVRHWLVGGRTDLDNLVLLCGFHHRLLHDRGYGVRREQAGWVFRRPGGEPVPTTEPPLDGNTHRLLEINTRAELRITPDSLTPTWGGERLDPNPILERLLPRVVPVAA